MKKFITNQRGMSISELVIVIGIITGLSVAAIPAFYYLQNQSRIKEFNETVKMIQSGLSSFKVKQVLLETPVSLTSLDHNPVGYSCENCFELVLEKGIKNPLWFKLDTQTYLYSANGNHSESADEYKEIEDKKVIFDPTKLEINTN